MKLFYILLLQLVVTFAATAQDKKKIDHTIYDEWKSIANIQQSKNGDWITYEINPALGDGYLFIENVASGNKDSIYKGENAVINYHQNFVVFKVSPGFDTTRALKLEKVDKSKWPLDTLGIYFCEADSFQFIPSIKSFKLSKEGNWLAYELNKDLTPDCPEPKKCLFFKRKSNCVKPNTSGKTLVLYNPNSKEKREIHGVVDYEFSKSGKYLAYVKSHKGEEDSLQITILNTINFEESLIGSYQWDIKGLNFSDDEAHILALTTTDTNKLKNYKLEAWSVDGKEEIKIDSLTTNMPENWTVSANFMPYFSQNGNRIILGTNRIIRQVAEDTLLSSEKAKVDVWSWDDPFIQPGQLINKRFEDRRTYLAAYDLSSSTFTQLADTVVKMVMIGDKGNQDFAIGVSTEGYEIERTWEYPWKSDYYLLDVETGEKQLIIQGIKGGGQVSPSGNFLTYFDNEDSAWYAVNIKEDSKVNLSEAINANFSDDNNGVPYPAQQIGSEGWIKIKGKEYFLAKSEYDIWAINPEKPSDYICITNKIGEKGKIKFNLIHFNRDSLYIQLNESVLMGTNDYTKSLSIWTIGDDFAMNKKLESDHQLVYISKAENSEQILIRRRNFIEYGELEVTSMQFDALKTLTNTNPQQAEYNWGTVEFTEWETFSGKNMRGLLYKPENFDSTKSYPMLVYFYEKYTDNIHAYYPPKATASIIYPTEYVSNGYIVFIPDVEYEPGHPAKSAYDCIVSGTEALYRTNSWIDSTRLGLQGQSWGGYQTAQLITMTKKYAAAMAGAPVSNMFSAYGGVRWGSGYSRMFQYERGQSRIGYTIWEKPELYIENSPLFGLPNVATPLLIMHNDGDGAVPWYQGIELYMGLRRLQQPVWLLNYNGDDHNLRQLANKKDLSIRMRQFFDYYLMGAPMPYWMKYGVDATEKGENYGLELISE